MLCISPKYFKVLIVQKQTNKKKQEKKTEVDSMLFNSLTNNWLLPKKYVSHLRGVFLDISKVIEKVQHEGLIFKLDRNDISGNLLKLLRGLPRCQKQRVILYGKTHPGKMLKLII